MGNRSQFRLTADWDRYYSNEKERNRINAKLNYDECKKLGICYKCYSPVVMNIKTGKLYTLCAKCREKENKRQRNIRNAPNLETPR